MCVCAQTCPVQSIVGICVGTALGGWGVTMFNKGAFGIFKSIFQRQKLKFPAGGNKLV